MARTVGEQIASIPTEQMEEAVNAYRLYKAAEKDFEQKRTRYKQLEAAMGDNLAGFITTLRRRGLL